MWKPKMPPHRVFKKKVFQDLVATSSFIYQIGQTPMLREASSEIPVQSIPSPDVQKKIAYMKRCLRRYRNLTGMGVGIAGAQVGIPERIIVVCLPKYNKRMFVLINPVITKRSQEKYLYPEICMSAAPCIAPVVRPAWIEFTYYDELGRVQRWQQKAEREEGKRYNRVFQHEIDHLDGIINIDLVESKDIIFESDPKFYKGVKFEDIS